MKKSVILLIALIYLAALLFVGFLGRNPKVFEEIIPVEKVEIVHTDETVPLNYDEKTWGKYIVIRPDESGRMQYQVNYTVYPKNATTDSIIFQIEAKPADCATIDEKSGLLVFTKQGMVKVFVVAEDGSTSQDTLTIIGRMPQN